MELKSKRKTNTQKSVETVAVGTILFGWNSRWASHCADLAVKHNTHIIIIKNAKLGKRHRNEIKEWRNRGDSQRTSPNQICIKCVMWLLLAGCSCRCTHSDLSRFFLLHFICIRTANGQRPDGCAPLAQAVRCATTADSKSRDGSSQAAQHSRRCAVYSIFCRSPMCQKIAVSFKKWWLFLLTF